MNFRNGWIGACVDEYEKAVLEFKERIRDMSDDEYNRIIDPVTSNNDTKSLHNITAHVVGAGKRMSVLQRNAIGSNDELIPNKPIPHDQIMDKLDELLEYTIQTGEMMQKINNEELMKIRIDAYWGTSYDPEQLFEHMVLHVQRHRRQLDKYHHGFYKQFE